MALFDEESNLSVHSRKEDDKMDKKKRRHKEKHRHKRRHKHKNREKQKSEKSRKSGKSERSSKRHSENRKDESEQEKHKRRKRKSSNKKGTEKQEKEKLTAQQIEESPEIATDEPEPQQNDRENEAVVNIEPENNEEHVDKATKIKLENQYVQYVFTILVAQFATCTIVIGMANVNTLSDKIREGEIILTAFVSVLMTITFPLILVLYNKPHLRKQPPLNYVVFGLFVIPQALAFAVYSQNLGTYSFLIFFATASGVCVFILCYGATKGRLTARKVRYTLILVIVAQALFGLGIIIVMIFDPRQQDTELQEFREKVFFIFSICISIFLGLVFAVGAFFEVCYVIRSREYDIEMTDYLYPIALYYCIIMFYAPIKFHNVFKAYKEESDSDEETNMPKQPEQKQQEDPQETETTTANEDEASKDKNETAAEVDDTNSKISIQDPKIWKKI